MRYTDQTQIVHKTFVGNHPNNNLTHSIFDAIFMAGTFLDIMIVWFSVVVDIPQLIGLYSGCCLRQLSIKLIYIYSSAVAWGDVRLYAPLNYSYNTAEVLI
mgnify:CR=1 FL=1